MHAEREWGEINCQLEFQISPPFIHTFTFSLPNNLKDNGGGSVCGVPLKHCAYLHFWEREKGRKSYHLLVRHTRFEEKTSLQNVIRLQ